ncbi:hypothetical protein CWI39_0630p0020 [Hamiltosporidium magnivora]|uniref:Uncharacterized protein n=1 Tax=Hamiltosporidium magnivora TaxID=148818 RepID=A0A4Q9LF65_9MICR|nr:hypothetical protein CWI39_0630p0020 [Hamiltosporidium magnivora]
MCEICLNILYSGWNIDFPGLKKEQFLDFIWFFYDLSCYSESDAIYIFYKNLLPFLFSYVADRSYFNVFRKPESEFSKYRKYFLPFLAVLYDSIYIYFDSNSKELLFLENKLNKNCDFVGLNSSKEIVIRTTPTAQHLIKEANTVIKKKVLLKLLNCYTLCGIRISADNKYYSEHKDSDTAYDFLKSDSCINDVKTHFSSVFEARKKIKKNYIKFIEFERVNLPSFDFFIYEI